jgi:enamine deaminase RidA (YjgF/YER057c/UK114 family)
MRESGLKLSATLLGFLCAMILAPTARGDEPRVSISGYDPVAYFTDGRPVQGSPEFEYVWHKLRWRFASAAHRDLFAGDPGHYAPQYDGYCAMGVAWEDPHKDTVDPQAWAIVDGKLYMVHTTYGLQKWRENAEEQIKRGNANWPVVAHLPEPVIVGPPCAASPPTVVVALRDGGHEVFVGEQVARDEAGNVVGKGDMRAQIEQVGKNVGGCLKAGGATVKDIVETVSRVTDPAEFSKYPDLRLRYFGPTSPQSTIVPVPQLGTDYLVQVEAFALIQ